MWSRKYANLVLYKCESCTTFLLLILRSSVSLSALDPQSFCSRNIQTHATWGTRPSLSDCRKNEHTDSQKFSELIELWLWPSLHGWISPCFLPGWRPFSAPASSWRLERRGADALPCGILGGGAEEEQMPFQAFNGRNRCLSGRS